MWRRNKRHSYVQNFLAWKGPEHRLYCRKDWHRRSELLFLHTHTHTHTPFTEARDSEWQWHQLGHMQVCTSLQTGNHASTPPLSFLQAGCPSCHQTNSVKAPKAHYSSSLLLLWYPKWTKPTLKPRFFQSVPHQQNLGLYWQFPVLSVCLSTVFSVANFKNFIIGDFFLDIYYGGLSSKLDVKVPAWLNWQVIYAMLYMQCWSQNKYNTFIARLSHLVVWCHSEKFALKFLTILKKMSIKTNTPGRSKSFRICLLCRLFSLSGNVTTGPQSWNSPGFLWTWKTPGILCNLSGMTLTLDRSLHDVYFLMR